MTRSWSNSCLSVLAWALIVMMLAIVVQVCVSTLDINPVWSFETAMPLLGDAISQNSLLDFQWHLLMLSGMVPLGIVWLRDGHVRVDFLYSEMSSRWKARIDIAGNLLFALPFFVFMLPASWDFTVRAWRSHEGSSGDGLNTLWLIKSVLPVGLALLAAAVLIETLRLWRAAR